MEEKSQYLLGSDGTIYDSKTSLTWKTQDSRQDLEKEITWQEAGDYAKEMNESQFGGHSDWRLPSLQEALSLYKEERLNKDFKGGDIHIDSAFPPGPGNCTWTSSIRGERESQIVFYLNGFAYWYEKSDKTISHAVRLVRR
jgi:hypothetical protein|tara:strand:- start:308 stop:730 length:423 start_codon:yes stop_codon:yes gene_type:complete